jgi:DNA polymerase type B, organellar and viral
MSDLETLQGALRAAKTYSRSEFYQEQDRKDGRRVRQTPRPGELAIWRSRLLEMQDEIDERMRTGDLVPVYRDAEAVREFAPAPLTMRFREPANGENSLFAAPDAKGAKDARAVEDLETITAAILSGGSNLRLTGFATRFPQFVETVEKTRRARMNAHYVESGARAEVNRRYVESGARAEARTRYTESGGHAKARERWQENNPDYDADRANDHYHRPFVALDFEGQDYKELDLVRSYKSPDQPVRRACYPKHGVFLGMAQGWERTTKASELDRIRDKIEEETGAHLAQLRSEGASAEDIERVEKDGRERVNQKLRDGRMLAADFIGDASKRPLATREILDWLVRLPERFPNAVFCSFAFNYDATQILRDLPRNKAYEITRRKKLVSPEDAEDEGGDDRRGGPAIGESPVLWGRFALKYLKSKMFQVWELKDPDNPFVYDEKTGKRKLALKRGITIYDTFGFYQSGFKYVSADLVTKGYFSEEDQKTIVENKAKRSRFNAEPFETVKHYCGLELEALSKAMTILRDGFDAMGRALKPFGGSGKMRLKYWCGAGAAAAALMGEMNLKADHFPEDISTVNPPEWQTVSHHAYFGGRIELLKQGFAQKTPLFGYDIASAYPGATVELPSMKGGKWTNTKRVQSMRTIKQLEELRQRIEKKNILSMFRVQWAFPQSLDIPLYPIPYRVERTGAILFPPVGEAWIMRDELRGAIEWIRTCLSGKRFVEEGANFVLLNEWTFEPANDARPFAFVEALYQLRAKTPASDPLNKAIKLCLNSLYGKTAQSIGGAKGKPPVTACPYYAAAITANCRMRLMFAALSAPNDIVMFATDGIISLRELTLDRVMDCDAPANKGRKPPLGDWEFNRSGGGFFVQSGIYTLFDRDGKPKSPKTRGIDMRNLITKHDTEQILMELVLPLWSKPFDKTPGIDLPYREFITIGSAVSGEERYKLRGRWADRNRMIDVHTISAKRRLIGDARPVSLYYSSGVEGEATSDDVASLVAITRGNPANVEACLREGLAMRCRMLVPSKPAAVDNSDLLEMDKSGRISIKLSAPRNPDWLVEEFGDRTEAEREIDEIMVSMA